MPKQGEKFQLKLIINKEKALEYSKILSIKTEHKRSNIKLKEIKGTLFIEISAKDATALRASANSILRDLQVIEATKL
ncbi:MAG: KEOPS complex subunit Pcc1 [Candidatus Micrarchaeaceae archaeon]|jgi:tRNA threonylcarbamoyladenosine modification (KEOPS) complex  Pcc1 subunit